MEATIVAICYIVTIFISRWMNKILYMVDEIESLPLIWFIPIFNVFFFLFGILFNIDSFDFKRRSWFTGKNWTKEQ